MKKYVYPMFLVLGDWSHDGHGKTDKVLIESNLPVEDVRQAYIDSCKLTGVQFNINEDFTGKERDWEEAMDMQILTEYDSPKITLKQFKVLYEHGLRVETLAKWNDQEPTDYAEDVEDAEEEYFISEEAFVPLWIWFVTLSNKDLVLTKSKQHDTIPNINGYGEKTLESGFGYGIYY
jgi:hypothetical protein